MVRKGSTVRVRQRALEEDPQVAAFSRSKGCRTDRAVLSRFGPVSTPELGAELLLLASGLGGALWWLNRRAMAQPSAQPISRILGAVSPDAITTILLAAADVLLLAGVDDGVYVLVPAMIAAIVGGVASAWLFLIRITA